jgi:hypothetical protein
MKFFGENFIFEVRIFIKVKICSAIWFFYLQILSLQFWSNNAAPLHLPPFQCRHIDKYCYLKTWITNLLKKMVGRVYYISVLLSNLIGLFIKSVYFINMFDCFLQFFFRGLVDPLWLEMSSFLLTLAASAHMVLL